MDATNLSIALLGCLVAMFVYFLGVHREIQTIKNQHEAALREVKEARKEFIETQKEITKALQEASKSNSDYIRSVDESVKKCQEYIVTMDGRIHQMDSLLNSLPDVQTMRLFTHPGRKKEKGA